MKVTGNVEGVNVNGGEAGSGEASLSSRNKQTENDYRERRPPQSLASLRQVDPHSPQQRATTSSRTETGVRGTDSAPARNRRLNTEPIATQKASWGGPDWVTLFLPSCPMTQNCTSITYKTVILQNSCISFFHIK
ncbi:hypothetical protein GDO81_016725 [Engystomops pustulosus]|uniref:Uncharacterized protein n=1 Tax=Engystomops pustulosus TaxID=76066 RepID=A0AAV7ACA4_ENGPU|nr:hypothetical protein GDO81_016725 [Engystomops pustulosus]